MHIFAIHNLSQIQLPRERRSSVPENQNRLYIPKTAFKTYKAYFFIISKSKLRLHIVKVFLFKRNREPQVGLNCSAHL